jgi:hypothetical protein
MEIIIRYNNSSVYLGIKYMMMRDFDRIENRNTIKSLPLNYAPLSYRIQIGPKMK